MPDIPQIESSLDAFDRKILEALAQNGRIPVAELAEKVGLSKTPCQNRFKRLIAESPRLSADAALAAVAPVDVGHDDEAPWPDLVLIDGGLVYR